MPWVIRKKGSQWCVYKKGTLESRGCHSTEAEAIRHMRALYKNVQGMSDEHILGSVMELQTKGPLLTTLPGVSIVKTGIEYPLSTGPRTFTTEDLLDAVKAQDDAAIPQPRIWLGHPDDPRLHGDRAGSHPSGEPAIGKVTNMRLEQSGHKIVGDLTGIPLWFARIMASAFPSRSIEGRSNWKTPTGNKWRFVINELALLGVVWPGVNTIEDIAALYSEEGPQIAVIEASEEQPVTTLPQEQREVASGLTVEELRRQLYAHLRTDKSRSRWWLRQVYVDPNELIVDDDNNSLFSINYQVESGKFKFGDPQQKRIEYVNASDGGIYSATKINEGRSFIAQFDKPKEDAVGISLTGKDSTSDSIQIKLGASK